MSNHTNKATHLILHHSAVSSKRQQFYAINTYHRRKYFLRSSLGFYACYHWIIERNGRKIQMRADGDTGCHTIGWNDKSIGICVVGDFRYQLPTEAQITSINALTRKYGLPVLLHREADTRRTCPAHLTQDMLRGFKQDKEDYEKAAEISKNLNLSFAWILNIIKLLKKFK